MTEAPDLIDGAARDTAITSVHSVLVQAPAGSGKTTLLAQRYLSLLARVDAPERILALTFTRLAAQEMRTRVLESLEAAAAGECPAHMNRRTFALGAAARRHLESLQIDIEAQPSRLRIETIDAFNAWLAGLLPVAAGAGSHLRILADADFCYEEAARRTLAYQEDDHFGAAVERLLALDDQRWRKLVKVIADMLPSRDQWLGLLAGKLGAGSSMDEDRLQHVRRQFDQDLGLLVARVLRRAQDVLGAERIQALQPLMHAAAQRLGKDAGPLSAWLSTAAPLAAELPDIERWRGMAALLLTAAGALRTRVTVEQGFPPSCADKAVMQDLLTEMQRQPEVGDILAELRALPAAQYSDAQWGRVREVTQVLVLAAAQLDTVFKEQGAVDFAAVSMAALRALGTDGAPTDLTLRLDYRLQHILVDEFQDTSSAQLTLVQQLTAGWEQGDGRSIFCVGDPMQSIYGFREAEVRAFLELAQVGIGAVRFDVQRLQSNFRSAAPLVNWTNACFARLMPQSDDRDRGAIAFRPSAAAAAVADGVEAGVTMHGFSGRGDEAQAIAGMIETAVMRHPAWRVAVLVRARSHAREIAAALRGRGIAFRAVDLEPLHDRAIVRDIIMLTRALLHAGDRIAWLALLRAPWAGVLLADLLIIGRAALPWEALRDESVLRHLSDDGRARCTRIREVLDAASRVRNASSLTRWVERTWLALGGASCAASAQELEYAAAAFARLHVLEQRGMPDAADLPASFSDLYAEHGTAGAVDIMTIHKAKGLEFDMVVLPALDRPVAGHRDQLLLSQQFARTGREGLVMAARPPVGADSDPLFDFLRRRRRDAATLEAQRLLYVACTRAKSQLRLTAAFGGADVPRAGSFLAVLWPAVRSEFPAAHTEAAASDDGVPSDAPRGGDLMRVPAGWSVVPQIMEPEGEAAVVPASLPETPIFDWAGEIARRVGSLVHAELQALDLTRVDAAAIRARAGHFRQWLALHGLPQDRLDAAAQRVLQALLAVHADPRGRWILKSGYRDDFREHALSGQWRGELIRVVFDRTFIDTAGVRWVIDYKTSQHLGSGLDEFLDREVERYRGQLQRYARLAQRLGPEPVRLGLYFPLMRAWREWAPAAD